MQIKNGPQQTITTKPIENKDASFVRDAKGNVHINLTDKDDKIDVNKGKVKDTFDVNINGQKYTMTAKEMAGATIHGAGGNDALSFGKGVGRETAAWDSGRGKDTFSYDLPTSVPGKAGDSFTRKETRRTETSNN